MNLHPATIAIIVVNILISLRGFNDVIFFDRYKFIIGAIKAGQRDRMVTSGFLHVDISHLFMNMFTLYFFAPVVINWFGWEKFLIIYFVSLVAGSLLALFFHKDEPFYSAVGASGAVTGILYAAILLQPDMQLGIMFIPIPIPAYVLGLAYMLYSIYGMSKQADNIGHEAHFGGASVGVLLCLLFAPNILFDRPLIVIGLLIPVIILMFFHKKIKPH